MVSILLVMAKPGSSLTAASRPRKPLKKMRRRSSPAAAKETSADAAVLSQLDGIFALKEELKAALEAFLGGKCFFLLFIKRLLWALSQMDM